MAQLRGTRKGGGVFDAVGNARAIYVVRFNCTFYSFCLDAKRTKKSRLIKIALNTTQGIDHATNYLNIIYLIMDQLIKLN